MQEQFLIIYNNNRKLIATFKVDNQLLTSENLVQLDTFLTFYDFHYNISQQCEFETVVCQTMHEIKCRIIDVVLEYEKLKASQILTTRRKKDSIAHFHCNLCDKWFSVIDVLVEREYWYCSWCGGFDKRKPLNIEVPT